MVALASNRSLTTWASKVTYLTKVLECLLKQSEAMNKECSCRIIINQIHPNSTRSALGRMIPMETILTAASEAAAPPLIRTILEPLKIASTSLRTILNLFRKLFKYSNSAYKTHTNFNNEFQIKLPISLAIHLDLYLHSLFQEKVFISKLQHHKYLNP